MKTLIVAVLMLGLSTLTAYASEPGVPESIASDIDWATAVEVREVLDICINIIPEKDFNRGFRSIKSIWKRVHIKHNLQNGDLERYLTKVVEARRIKKMDLPPDLDWKCENGLEYIRQVAKWE